MKALVIIAHGSRNLGSNQEIENLIVELNSTNSTFDLTAHAFLELTQPDIPFALESVISQGARHVFVLPYFLARGNHVESDIPKLIDEAAKTHPDVVARLKEYAEAMRKELGDGKQNVGTARRTIGR